MNKPLKFPPNTPVEVALSYSTGKPISTRFGIRIMFTLVGGQVMFLHSSTALKISRAAIRPGERFFICRDKKKRGALDFWRVWRPLQQSELQDHSFSTWANSLICKGGAS